MCVQDLPPDLAHDGGRILLRAPPERKRVINEVHLCEADIAFVMKVLISPALSGHEMP